MLLAAAGAAGGVVATLTAGRVVSSLLYEARADDIRIVSAVVVVMFVVAMVASLAPAKRATTIEPLVALRGD